MSKENAVRFMMMKDKDEDMKSAYDDIIRKYEGKKLSKAEWDMAIQEEVIPLAKKYGFDFTPENFTELLKTADGKLSDEELGEVVGGQGQFSVRHQRGMPFGDTTTYCDCAPDDATFITRYGQSPTDCPDYVCSNTDAPQRTCRHCKNSYTMLG